jgi:hypothetical protein
MPDTVDGHGRSMRSRSISASRSATTARGRRAASGPATRAARSDARRNFDAWFRRRGGSGAGQRDGARNWDGPYIISPHDNGYAVRRHGPALEEHGPRHHVAGPRRHDDRHRAPRPYDHGAAADGLRALARRRHPVLADAHRDRRVAASRRCAVRRHGRWQAAVCRWTAAHVGGRLRPVARRTGRCVGQRHRGVAPRRRHRLRRHQRLSRRRLRQLPVSLDGLRPHVVVHHRRSARRARAAHGSRGPAQSAGALARCRDRHVLHHRWRRALDGAEATTCRQWRSTTS